MMYPQPSQSLLDLNLELSLLDDDFDVIIDEPEIISEHAEADIDAEWDEESLALTDPSDVPISH